jgi:hypothetical protein
MHAQDQRVRRELDESVSYRLERVFVAHPAADGRSG